MCYRSRHVLDLLLIHDISQGSVATHLRCGGIFSDNIIVDFLLNLIMKKFENRLIFDKVTAYKKLCQIFWAILYTCTVGLVPL